MRWKNSCVYRWTIEVSKRNEVFDGRREVLAIVYPRTRTWKKLHEEMRKDFAGCLSKVSYHDAQIRALNNSIDDMKKRIRLAEQIGLKHEIVINGIPGDLSLGESASSPKLLALLVFSCFPPILNGLVQRTGWLLLNSATQRCGTCTKMKVDTPWWNRLWMRFAVC